MKITWEDRVTISPDVMMQEVGGEAVLLDLQSETYFGLDAVGTRVWQLVEHDGQMKSIEAALLAEYDVSAERLQSDLLQLVAQLAEKGLVQVSKGPANANHMRGGTR